MRKLAPFLLVFIVGCSGVSFERNAVNTLSTIATFYENSMAGIRDLHAKGLITDEERTQIVKAAIAVWSAYHEAELILEIYTVSRSAEDKQKLEAALAAVTQRFDQLLQYAEPLLKRSQ